MPRLHCLGTAGYHPNEDRHTSCYTIPEWALVLDAGTGIFRLPRFMAWGELDILLSHAHLDHVFGLTVLLDIAFQKPLRAVRVWGHETHLKDIRGHLLDRSLFPVDLPLEWMPVKEQQVVDHESILLPAVEEADGRCRPKLQIACYAQEHPRGSLAYRVGESDLDGRNLVYATDTTGDSSDEFSQFANPCHLLIHECNFGDEHKDLAKRSGHTYRSRLIEVIRSVGPEKTLVTHFNPLDQRKDPVDSKSISESTGSSVLSAFDGMAIDV